MLCEYGLLTQKEEGYPAFLAFACKSGNPDILAMLLHGTGEIGEIRCDGMPMFEWLVNNYPAYDFNDQTLPMRWCAIVYGYFLSKSIRLPDEAYYSCIDLLREAGMRMDILSKEGLSMEKIAKQKLPEEVYQKTMEIVKTV